MTVPALLGVLLGQRAGTGALCSGPAGSCMRFSRRGYRAGSGVAAIAAAKAGAIEVLAVDRDPLARAAVTMNAVANGVQLCHQ